ncbi:MAG: hypothetical protein L0196_00050 [candidate division Zixibacteria bacterium]|nr:hypothetical protein [candidate division Zixibacteria bacterium]
MSLFPSPSGGLPDLSYATEVKRKLIHFGSLSIPAVIWYLPKNRSVWVLGIALVGSLVVEFLRHRIPADAKGWRHLAALFRPNEKGSLSGSSYILLSAVLAAAFFRREIAALSLVYVVVGDVAGALMGRRFGRHRLFDKSWEGSIAFFLACLTFSPLVPGLSFAAKIAAAAVATIVESLPLKLDDNLTVPLGTAGFLTLIS